LISQKLGKDFLIQVCKQASKTQRDLQVIGTLTFTIHGEIAVFYKLEERGREKEERESKSRSKSWPEMCTMCDYRGI